MRKALRYILILIIVGVLIIAGGLGAIYLVPNTFAQDDGTQVLVIEKGGRLVLKLQTCSMNEVLFVPHKALSFGYI